jgi:hypothetical protein
MLSNKPNVLSKLHLRILGLVASVQREGTGESVLLVGGTALAAYYLGHRRGDDVQVVAGRDLDTRAWGEAIRHAGGAHELLVTVEGSSLGLARLLIQDTESPTPVTVSLQTQTSPLLDPPQPTVEGVRVASFRDLAAETLRIVTASTRPVWDRYKLCDYLDLHAALTLSLSNPESEVRHRRFWELTADVMAIDAAAEPHRIGEGLSRGLDQSIVKNPEVRLLVPITDEEIQQTIRACFDDCATLVAKRLHT